MGDEHRPQTWGGSGKKSVQAVRQGSSTPAPAAPVYEDDGPDATDAAKALAAEHNIDLASITGTGSEGRITKDDVQAQVTPAETDEEQAGDTGDGEPEQPEVG